jgi:hypothetical protein
MQIGATTMPARGSDLTVAMLKLRRELSNADNSYGILHEEHAKDQETIRALRAAITKIDQAVQTMVQATDARLHIAGVPSIQLRPTPELIMLLTETENARALLEPLEASVPAGGSDGLGQ